MAAVMSIKSTDSLPDSVPFHPDCTVFPFRSLQRAGVSEFKQAHLMADLFLLLFHIFPLNQPVIQITYKV